ncbi:MAG: hypothetical protein ACRDEA_17065, partial [Microcystaceae cyanobacterium]
LIERLATTGALYECPEKAMQYLRRMSYIQVKDGWQTYLFGSDYKPIPYKFLTTKRRIKRSDRSMPTAGLESHRCYRLN